MQVSAALLLACPSAGGAQVADGKDPSALVASIGETGLDKTDLALRLAMLEARGRSQADSAQALVELMTETLEGEVARAVGALPSEEELTALDAHASASSREPEVLATIRAMFDDDRKRYQRQVLASRVTPLKLRRHHAHDRDSNAEARRAIETAWRLIRKGSTFAEAAEAVGEEVRRFVVGGRFAADPLMSRSGPLPGDDSIASIVAALAEGEIYRSIVEGDERLVVIRRLGQREDGRIDVEAIVVAKRPYDAWYREQAGQIRIVLHDRSLAEEACRRYGTTWWLECACAGW